MINFKMLPKKTLSLIETSLLAVVVAIMIFNQWHVLAVHQLLPAAQAQKGGSTEVGLLPHGVPDKYGAELGINFDQAASAIKILENFDRGSGAIKLTGDKLARYIKIGTETACEFCCGAKTLVFADGKAACGCAHSAAMRGVALYLLEKYPEMSDADILSEVNRWKAAFFPGPTMKRSGVSQSEAAVPAQVGGC